MQKNDLTTRVTFLATRGGYIQLLNPISKPTSTIRLALNVGETTDRVQAIEKPSTIFTGWSDGVKSNPRTHTVTKEDYENGGVEITANFSSKYWFIGGLIDWIWSMRNPIRVR